MIANFAKRIPTFTNRLASSHIVASRLNSTLPSLYTLSDEEVLLRDAVAKFANEQVRPKVRAMDEAELLDKS
ncbi:UNVERIFIED_CONTAM: hypothetical protein HDU68_002144, partial [Siphonaria sp. JEL0065]